MGEACGVILMAVYRPKAALFTRQVESIRAQTHTEWLCVIGIDGADSGTRILVETLTGDDPRFSVVQFDDRVGFYRNFERIATRVDAGFEWVAFADQDDYWYPEKLERLTAVLQRPGVMAVTGQARLVDAEGRPLGRTDRRPDRLADMILDNAMTGSFMLVKPLVLHTALPFPDQTEVAFHDHWIGVCAAALGQVSAVPDAVQDYVQHGGNVIGESGTDSMVARWRRVDAEGLEARLTYVARERWGWRVGMAQELLRRGPELSPAALPALRAVARGTLSSRLLVLVLSGVVRRRVPALRALALLAGAAWWRRVENQMSGGEGHG